MRSEIRLIFAILAAMPAVAPAQSGDIDEWSRRIVESQSELYEPIDDLTRKTTTMGMATFEYYEKAPPFEFEGETIHTLRMVPPSEIQQRHNEANGISSPSAADMAAAADQIEMAGIDMERQMASEMQSSGMPGGLGTMLANPPPDQPWLSSNPSDMTWMYATMLRAGAEGEEAMAAEQAGIPADYMRNMQEMRSKMSVRGYSEFDGKPVVDIGADDLDFSQVTEGQTVTCHSMQTLVSTEDNVPLYFKMNCEVTEGGESRQMSIEREAYDFRSGPGCGAYTEPFRTVMRIGGVMTPEEEAQLAEASVQLKEMEAQLASMPASQRQMMENMMGPQLEMIRNMASGGGMQFVQEVAELRCNTGLPDPAEISQTMMSGAMPGVDVGAMIEQERTEAAARDEQERAEAATRKVAADEEMREITARMQASLVTLGYQPGNTDGVLDKATVVAISQFEAVRGLPVTGQPSWELAGMLGRAVEDGAFRAPR
jgi:hypothetical protein